MALRLIVPSTIQLLRQTRFDYRKGETERATRTLTKVYGAPKSHFAVNRELEDIEAKLRAETAKQSGIQEWINMWKAPKMFYRIALGMTLQMFQQLTGANYLWVSPLPSLQQC